MDSQPNVFLLLGLLAAAAFITVLLVQWIQVRKRRNKHYTFHLWLHKDEITIRDVNGELVGDPLLSERIIEQFKKHPAPRKPNITVEYYPDGKKLEVVQSQT